MSRPRRALEPEEAAIYEWQTWVAGFGAEGQEKLKAASVMVSRVGGVGGLVAYELAAAGVGRLILAHAGAVKPSDLNRQLLMTHGWVGKPRIESIVRRLRDLNPRLELEACGENVTLENVERLVGRADVVVDCAPLFAERFLMNDEAVRQRKPLVECAMYELEAQLTTIIPGATPCLRCLYPEDPPAWRRQFPVFGAVAGAIGCMAAVEAIKLIAGLGEPTAGRLLTCDFATMTFRSLTIRRNPACAVCGPLT
jgi:molybdopterin/thiamine biosynthesis adenylyltransferase